MANVALPACDAWIVHVPAATIVTVAPLTLHTGVVSDEKLTGKAEDVVALTVNGATPYVLPLSAANVIVWLLSAVAAGMPP